MEGIIQRYFDRFAGLLGHVIVVFAALFVVLIIVDGIGSTIYINWIDTGMAKIHTEFNQLDASQTGLSCGDIPREGGSEDTRYVNGGIAECTGGVLAERDRYLAKRRVLSGGHWEMSEHYGTHRTFQLYLWWPFFERPATPFLSSPTTFRRAAFILGTYEVPLFISKMIRSSPSAFSVSISFARSSEAPENPVTNALICFFRM
jgi:hypothetical protein